VIYARKCTRCGGYGIRSNHPLDEAIFADATVQTSYSYDPRRPAGRQSLWEAQVLPSGVAWCGGCVFNEWTADPSNALSIDRDITAEDRISVDTATGTPTLARVVVACTFGALATAQAFASALSDAISAAVLLLDEQPATLCTYLPRLGPYKHPTLSQWAVMVRPKMRFILTSRAQALLVRAPGDQFEGVALANPFWRTDLSTTTTRYNQLVSKLATYGDLDSTWGL
jgi:hypothetical protein